MICELCGKDVPRTRTVSIEGTVLTVCGDCARFGSEVAGPIRVRRPGNPAVTQRLERRARRMTERDVYDSGEPEELVEDFGERIRRAREAHGWKQTDLGAKINEKASIIARLEAGSIVPPDAMIPKLERALGIRLKEKPEPVSVKKHTGPTALTLGDLIRMDEE